MRFILHTIAFLLQLLWIVSAYDNSSLLLTTIEHMMKHDSYSELFQNILHPILTQQPQLFNTIMHKILSQQPHSKLGQYFVITATKPIFDKYIIFNNDNYTTSNEIWKLLKMVDHHWLFSHSLFENISYDINGSNKFHVDLNISSNFRNFAYYQNTSIDKINWSEIPRFIRSIKAHYLSNDFIKVDLSSIDQSCSVTKLTIAMRNGVIILPDYQLPSSLKMLTLVHKNGIGIFRIDFTKLWTICSNIKQLGIYQRRMKLSEFNGFEHMKKLKLFQGNFCNVVLAKISIKINARYKNASISFEQLKIESNCLFLGSVPYSNMDKMKLVLDDQISVEIKSSDVDTSESCTLALVMLCLASITTIILVLVFTQLR
eukprot:103457_1